MGKRINHKPNLREDGTFQDRLARWVVSMLFEHTELERDPGTNALTKLKSERAILKEYFSGKAFPYMKMERATFRTLCNGGVVKAETIKHFAKALNLPRVDEAELWVRWGEAVLERYSYRVDDSRKKGFVREWTKDLFPALKSVKAKNYEKLNVLPTELLSETLRLCIEGCRKKKSDVNIKRSDIKIGSKSTMDRVLRDGRISAKHFKMVLISLDTADYYHPPASPDAKLDKVRQKMIVQKLCGHYIEVQAGFPLLALTISDLEKFNPEFHHRLAHWLIACGLPNYVDSTPLELDGYQLI